MIVRGDYKPKIVVNSIFKAGQTWVVNVSSSRDFLVKDSEMKPIENARVTIIEKTTTREIRLEHQKDGNYTYPYFPPEMDKTYKLIVEVPGYETVTSSSKAPKKANVVNVISDIVDKNVTKVNFDIKDNTNNYLIWNFISSSSHNPLDTNYNSNPKNLVSNIIKYNNITSYLGALTDAENNGVVQEGSFSGNVKTIDNSETGNPEETETIVETKKFLRMLTTSVDLYNYYKTVEKFTSTENHNSSFSYSPNIYSNIKNGLGIFAGYTEEYREIK
jgi:hypothetical protein